MASVSMTSRKSVPVLATPLVTSESLEINMLYEDFRNRVVPYRNNPKAYFLSVSEVPAQDVERGLSLGINSRGVDEFVRRVACSLLRGDDVWIELVGVNEASESLPFRICEVIGVTRTADGRLVQQISDESHVAEWYQCDDIARGSVDLDEDTMIQVVAPEDYPGNTLKGVFAALAEIRPLSSPEWAMQKILGNRPASPSFDVDDAYRVHRLRTLQAALPIGWTAREVLLGDRCQINEYYYFWRELRFLHFLASMRECAESGLREVLTLAGKLFGFSASVTGNGLYRPEDICVFTRRFEAGELGFGAVTDIILERADRSRPDDRCIV